MKGIQVAIDVEPWGHDLFHVNDYVAAQVYYPTARPLVAVHGSDQAPSPFGAIEFENRGKEVTFVLREAYFSNGRRCSGHDYERGLKHLIRHHPGLRIYFSSVVGYQDRTLDGIRGGTDTVSFRLSHPDAALPVALSSPQCSPLCQIDPGAASGAYFIAERSRESIVLRRNPYAKMAKDFPEEIRYRIVTEISDSLRRYNAGSIDITCDTQLSTEYIGTIREHPDLIVKPGHLLMALRVLTFDHPLLSLRHFRHALLYGLDRNAIADEVGWGVAPIASRSPFIETTDGNGFFNAELANREIRRSPQMADIRIGYCDFWPNKIVLLAIAKQMKEFGINIIPVLESYPIRRGSVDVRLEIISPPFDHSYAAYLPEAYTKLFQCDKAVWRSYLEALIGFRKAIGRSEQASYSLKLEEILRDHAAVIPICRMQRSYLARPHLRNFELGPQDVTHRKPSHRDGFPEIS
jgi:hypothetical protein